MSTDIRLKTTHKPIYFLHAAFVFILMCGFGRLPAFEPLTPLGMQVLGIFLGMLWGWLFCSMVWPSVLGLIALGLTNYCSITEAFTKGFSNSTIILYIFLLSFIGIMEEAGLSKWLAFKIVSLKIAKGRPWVLTMLIWVAVIVCSSSMSILVSIIIAWEIVYTICDLVGYKKGDSWPAFVLAGVTFFACVASVVFPFAEYPVLVLGTFKEISGGASLNFVSYFICMLSFLVVATILYFLVVRYVFKPDVSKLKNAEISFENVGKLTNYQRFLLGSLIAAIIMFLLPSILPSTWAVTKILANLGVAGVAALGIALLLILGFEGVPSIGKMVGHVNWNLLFMLLGALTIAGVLRDDATGFNAWLSQLLTPFTAGQSGFGFAIVLTMVAITMTQLCNNFATSTICVSLAYNISMVTNDINISAIVICIICGCSLALLLPSGSAVAAMAYGNDWIPKRIAFLCGALAVLIGIFCCIFVIVPLSQVLF